MQPECNLERPTEEYELMRDWRAFPTIRRKLERIVYHEAGHAVGWHLYGCAARVELDFSDPRMYWGTRRRCGSATVMSNEHKRPYSQSLPGRLLNAVTRGSSVST
jgi:hypothetical protein